MQSILPSASAQRTGQGQSQSKNIAFWIAALVLGGLLLWQLVRLLLLLISPAAPVGGWQPRQAVIAPADQREAILSRYNPFSGNSLAVADPAAGPTRVTALDLVLYGTRFNGITGDGSAIIAGSDGVQQNFLVGDEVLPGVKLVAVAFDNVTLERSGARESLFIDQSNDVQPVSPDNADASAEDGADEAAAKPESAPASASTLAKGVAFAPRLDGGKVTGLSLSSQGDGEAFKTLGFRAGDVIVEYDGKKVSSAEDAAALIAKARPGGRFSVLIERGANVVPIAIIVPEN